MPEALLAAHRGTYRELLVSYREVCVRAAHRMGGEVSRYLGDGLLIPFGWPTAFEDDARRAVLESESSYTDALRAVLAGSPPPPPLPSAALISSP